MGGQAERQAQQGLRPEGREQSEAVVARLEQAAQKLRTRWRRLVELRARPIRGAEADGGLL